MGSMIVIMLGLLVIMNLLHKVSGGIMAILQAT